MDNILEYLGRIVAYGGGGATVAYLLFRFLGKSWIDSKFAERLEHLRHTQALEIQRLRAEIDSVLSGAIKLQDREFQTLPEAWGKLDEAYGRLSHLVSPLQAYPDLDHLAADQLDEFLAGTSLRESEKQKLRQTGRKTAEYREIIFWHRLGEVRRSIADLHSYIERNSIFLSPQLKRHFEESTKALWDALTSKELGHEAEDWKMQNEGWDKIRKEVAPLRETIREAIYKRLQAHGRVRV